MFCPNCSQSLDARGVYKCPTCGLTFDQKHVPLDKLSDHDLLLRRGAPMAPIDTGRVDAGVIRGLKLNYSQTAWLCAAQL